MGARRAPCVDDSEFPFRSRRAEDCAPYLFLRLALQVSRYARRMDLRMKPMSAARCAVWDAATKRIEL